MDPKPSAKHEAFVRNTAPERNEQAPLGPHPSYDEVLDVAVEYTFPASDPVAVESSCKDADRREDRERRAQPDRAAPGGDRPR
jgi:predicted component of type VI protein secretion system